MSSVKTREGVSVKVPVPVLYNGLPLNGAKGYVLVKKSDVSYDVEWVELDLGRTDEEIKSLIKDSVNSLQPKIDDSLETSSKKVFEAINENFRAIKSVKEDSSRWGSSLSLVVDPKTYVMKISLKNTKGDLISEQSVDLPIEQMVVKIEYESSTSSLIFTLKTGSTLKVPLGDLMKGLVSESKLTEEIAKVNKAIADSVKGLQPKEDASLNTKSKKIAEAINEVLAIASTNSGGLNKDQVKEIVKETIPNWANQPTKPEYTYSEIKYTPALLSLGETDNTAYSGAKGKRNAEDIAELEKTKQNKISFDGEYSALHNKVATVETVTREIAKIVAGADASFDTLKEIADWIKAHPESVAKINALIQTNAQNISKNADAIHIIQNAINELSEKKLDKITESNKLYGTDENGNFVAYSKDDVGTNVFVGGEKVEEFNADAKADKDEVDSQFETINKILFQSGTVYKGNTETAYTERVTADGANVLDGSKAVLKKVVGSTVACRNLFNNLIIENPLTMTPLASAESLKAILDKGQMVVRGFNGTTFNNPNIVSAIIPIKNSTSYICNGFSKQKIQLLDENFSVVGEGNSDKVTATNNVGAKYAYIYVFNIAQGPSQQTWSFEEVINNFQFEEGTTTTAYQPYFTGLKSASFAGLESKNADGTEKSTLSFPKTENPEGQIIDFERQVIIFADSTETPFTEEQKAIGNEYTVWKDGTEKVLGNDNAEYDADNTLTQNYLFVKE